MNVELSSSETAIDASLTAADLEQLRTLGISREELRRQLAWFESPPPPARLVRPARVGDGILELEHGGREDLISRFDAACERGAVSKLVPASGAATRMFRSLAPLLENPPGEPGREARKVFTYLDRFAFYEDLVETAQQQGLDLAELQSCGDCRTLAELLLTSRGLGLAALAKGLIPFHRYPEGPRTAFEEQLLEGAAYTRDRDGVCRLHFTVTPEDESSFRRVLARAAPVLGGRLAARFDVGFSHQSHATDTVAVDPDNRPFRLEDGSLLFRPGGHGSLIGNLAALGREGAEVVLIKNVDNVVPETHQGVVVRWKKLLGGVLLEVRDLIWALLERLEEPASATDPTLLAEAAEVLAHTLSRPLPAAIAAAEPGRLRQYLIEHLDRPLRVCGMVPNQGEAGGGPFWVDSHGERSLQIVEAAQIDQGSDEQRQILAASTHFNPVDLVCSVRDHRGLAFDLERFVDPQTVFIAAKSHRGRPLKALERPGLWNGAMAGWNTVFVEVPLATFSPVKTLADLLRPEHQVESGR